MYHDFRLNLIYKIAQALGVEADHLTIIEMNRALTKDLLIAARCLGLV